MSRRSGYPIPSMLIIAFLFVTGCGDSITGPSEALNQTDADGDGYTIGGGDCDDSRADVHPAGVEVCGDDIDQDCSGEDQECTEEDVDGDGVSPVDGDCNDNDPTVSPNVAETPYNGKDDDCDPDTRDEDVDNDRFPHDTDCDDNNPRVNPDAREIAYDGIDQDCSGGDLTDVDEDGFDGGARGDDCDDGDVDVNPDATEEFYDGVDQDCSGGSDYDQDGDGADSFFENGGPDCDDTDDTVMDCGSSPATAAPSCKAIKESNDDLESDTYWIDPPENTSDPFEAYCDMTSDGGGYTFYKYSQGSLQDAADAEDACEVLGMQLFIPRSPAHLASAVALAQNDDVGPDGSLEYLSLMGVYPNAAGAECANEPLNSENAACNWGASDDGPYYISNRTNIAEPSGDNDLNGSLVFTFNAGGLVTYDDVPAPGATGRRWMCDVGDKIPEPARNCFDIKNNNPDATDGVYTIDPTLTGTRLRVYCDMTYDGGGWTLVGKGRQGWQWTNSGRGTPDDILDKDDFAVAYLDNMTVQNILGKPLNTAVDGLRIYRLEPNQEIRWRYLTATTFTWLFDTEIQDVEYEIIGMSKVIQHTQNSQITGNDDTRLFTFAWDLHNYVQGFALGNEGPNAQTGWMFSNEGHSIPHALVYVRE